MDKFGGGRVLAAWRKPAASAGVAQGGSSSRAQGKVARAGGGSNKEVSEKHLEI